MNAHTKKIAATAPLTFSIIVPRRMRIQDVSRRKFPVILKNTGQNPIAVGLSAFAMRIVLTDAKGKLRNDPHEGEEIYKWPAPTEKDFFVISGRGALKDSINLKGIERNIRPGRYFITAWFQAVPYGEWPRGIDKKFGRKHVRMWYGERVSSPAMPVQIVE